MDEQIIQPQEQNTGKKMFSYLTPLVIGIVVVLVVLGGFAVVKFSEDQTPGSSENLVQEAIETEVPEDSDELIDSLIIDEDDDVTINEEVI